MTKFIEVTGRYDSEKFLVNIGLISYIKILKNGPCIVLNDGNLLIKESYEQIKEMIGYESKF